MPARALRQERRFDAQVRRRLRESKNAREGIATDVGLAVGRAIHPRENKNAREGIATELEHEASEAMATARENKNAREGIATPQKR